MKSIFAFTTTLLIGSTYGYPYGSAKPEMSMTASEASSNQTQAAAGGLDLGSCQNAAIAFGVGFEGRKEGSFEPDDQSTFKHGSAQSMLSYPHLPYLRKHL